MSAPIVEESVVINTTPDQITLKPIKKNGWLPDDHDGSIRYSKCFERLTVQALKGSGVLNTGLTEEDVPSLIDRTRKIMRDALLADPKGVPLKAANKYKELKKK